jgi:hypothetical protein
MTRRTRLVIWLHVIALVWSVGVLAALFLFAGRREITRDDMAKIKMRMTEEEVEAILGRPSKLEIDAPDRSVMKEWTGSKYCLHATFSDGELVYYGWSRNSPESLYDKLRRWFVP